MKKEESIEDRQSTLAECCKLVNVTFNQENMNHFHIIGHSNWKNVNVKFSEIPEILLEGYIWKEVAVLWPARINLLE